MKPRCVVEDGVSVNFLGVRVVTALPARSYVTVEGR